jgi:hypothetical protein
VGLATLVGSVLVLLGGIAVKYSSSIKNYIRPINVKLYHATLALIGKKKFTKNILDHGL